MSREFRKFILSSLVGKHCTQHSYTDTNLYAVFTDSKEELKKLNGSIVISFLELLDVLINCPSSPQVPLCSPTSLV